MGVLIPQPPNDIHNCPILQSLRQKSTPSDGLSEKVEQFLVIASPLLDLIVAGPFREYTLHNPGHAKKLVHLTGQILSDETQKKLSALECTVIVYAAFLHDMGMCLTSTERERIIQGEEFIESLPTWQELWRELESARSRLRSTEGSKRLPLETKIFQLHEAALAAYLRPRHATQERYLELLDRIERQSGRSDLFALNGVSFRDALVDICVSHNLDVGVLTEARGPYDERFPRALAIGGQRLNTQFCAAILRLTDILDFDRERTPRVLFESLGIAQRVIPGAELSLREWQKHMSVHALEIAGEELVVSADSYHPAIESAIREFCRVIERELRDTAAVLRRNTPEVLESYNVDLPVVVRPQIRSHGYVFKDMSFRLNKSSILNLFMGEQLYSRPEAAVRELIQNALDACSARAIFEAPGYVPTIAVTATTDEEGRTWLEVRDSGIGMDEHVLLVFA
jgi:signal transduction histidine kinase